MSIAVSTSTTMFKRTVVGRHGVLRLRADVRVAERLGDEVGARASAELGHGVAHVRADGLVGDAELGRDLCAVLYARDQAYVLELALRHPAVVRPIIGVAPEMITQAQHVERDEEN